MRDVLEGELGEVFVSWSYYSIRRMCRFLVRFKWIFFLDEWFYKGIRITGKMVFFEMI